MKREGGRRRDLSGWRASATLASVGLTLALSIATGIGIGYVLDQKLGTRWWVIVFTLIGVVAGFKQLIQAVIVAGQQQDEVSREEREERDRQ